MIRAKSYAEGLGDPPRPPWTLSGAVVGYQRETAIGVDVWHDQLAQLRRRRIQGPCPDRLLCCAAFFDVAQMIVSILHIIKGSLSQAPASPDS